MNRTLTVLGLAALLALLAALLGVRDAETPPEPRPSSPPVITPRPTAAGAVAEAGGIRLHAQLTHPLVSTGTTDAFLVVSLKADETLPETRLPLHLALVLDRSASMAGPRLRHARESARRLIHGLSEHDHLAIVHYGSEAVALPALRADPEGRARMLDFVDAIEAEGGTNLEEALQLASDSLPTHGPALRKVLLISDGQPTVGEVDPEALVVLADAMQRRGLTLDALGVGEDFNEELLVALARAGDGTYAFLRDGAALPQRVLQHHARATNALAGALRIGLTPGPHVELLEVLGHPLERQGAVSRLRLPGLAAGEGIHFVARVRIHADGHAEVLDAVELELEVHEAGTDRRLAARTMVSARHTPSPDVAASHRDPALTPTVVRALAARNTALAADALAAYQPEEASAHLDDTRALLTSLTSPHAELAVPDVQALRLLQDALRHQEARVRAASATGGGLGASEDIKTLRLVARQGFGLQGELP